MRAYYNEIDEYAAQWLRNLIAAGHITPGDVDTRSIEDVTPADLIGYDRCHFFAGIGVWDYALNRAGWGTGEVWTGSCPCQPFSVAGKGDGFADERHLWPAFHWLIEQRRPVAVFGEQVASKDASSWIDLVQNDLEAMGYSVGAVPFPAASVGAPHIRDRMYWVADTLHTGLEKRVSDGRIQRNPVGSSEGQTTECGGNTGGMADTSNERRDGKYPLLQRQESGRLEKDSVEIAGNGATRGFWSAADWIYCRDEKYRPVEPGTFPLAHGATARVGRLRAYGNAICAPQAEEFIKAYLETRP